MDYEKITDTLISRVMEEFKVSEEYQSFLDFLPQSIDFNGDFSDDNVEARFRKLLDQAIDTTKK